MPRGLRTVVVVSRGFAEIGAEGAARQRELVAVCRQAGMRLVGPNCMGVINPEPDVRLNATFRRRCRPRDGSGSPRRAARSGWRSSSTRTGWAWGCRRSSRSATRRTSPATTSSSTGRTTRPARSSRCTSSRWGTRGSSPASRGGSAGQADHRREERPFGGRRPPTSSHTGALIGASDLTVDALFHQAGVVRTDTLCEFFDAARRPLEPAPAGRPARGHRDQRGRSGDPRSGRLRGGRPRRAAHRRRGPRGARGLPAAGGRDGEPGGHDRRRSPASFRRAIETLAAWDGIDALIVLFVPPLGTRAEDVAAAIHDAVAGLPRPIPVLAVFMAAGGGPAALQGDRVRVPVFSYPEEAVRALAHRPHTRSGARRRPAPSRRSRTCARTRARPSSRRHSHGPAARPGAVPRPVGPLAGSSLGGSVEDARSGWLAPDEVAALLDCYGIATAEWRLAATPRETGERRRGDRRPGGPEGGEPRGRAQGGGARGRARPRRPPRRSRRRRGRCSARSRRPGTRSNGSSSSGWSRAGWRCSSASSTTGSSARSWRARAAGPRPSSCGTWRCGSRP